MDKENFKLDIENSTEAPFVKFFNTLAQDEHTVRFFVRGQQEDYYSVHGKDAQMVAEQVYRTTGVIKYIGGKQETFGLPSVALSKNNMESFARDLLTNFGLRIEIYKLEPKKNNSWFMWKRASPGYLADVDDLIFRNIEPTAVQVIASVKLTVSAEQKMLGVAFCDASSMAILNMVEFVDNDVFSCLEVLLVQISAKECIVSTDDTVDMKKMKATIERMGIVISEAKALLYSVKDFDSELGRLIDSNLAVNQLPEHDMKHSLSALACLVHYLGLLDDPSNEHKFALQTFDLQTYARLDPSALTALNVMPGIRDGGSKSNTSLFGLLNKCATSQGSRLLHQWLHQPLRNIDEIEKRFDIVEAFFKDSKTMQTLQAEHLRTFPDLARVVKRLHRPNGSLSEVVRLYQAVSHLSDMIKTFQESTEQLLADQFLPALEEANSKLVKFLELVESTIDLDALDDHRIKVKAEFDPNLQESQKELFSLKEKLDSEASSIAAELDMELGKKLKFEFTSVHGHYMRLSRNDASVLRQHRNLREISCQKSGVFFQSSAMKTLSEEHRDAQDKYERFQSGLAKEIKNITLTYSSVFDALNFTVSNIDVYASLAKAALYAPIPYVRPQLSKDKCLELKAARHPCLEQQDNVSFISNDVSMNDANGTFHIITGPNMGGKSTYIRQIGMISLMAQIGSFVPCASAKMSVVDAILARVGAGDSQMKGISTFMAEMIETATILNTATEHSLIIIDELGRGTSTFDGFGLAYAISEHIAKNVGCFCLFATHFHELTQLEHLIPTVKNYHVTALAEKECMTLLYKVDSGVSDQSFGIHVAEMAKFPAEIVKLAKRKAAELEEWEQGSIEGKDRLSDDISKRFQPQELEEARSLMSKFLNEFSMLPALQNSDTDGNLEGNSEALQQVKQLQAKYQHSFSSNNYIQQLFESL